MVFVDPTTRQLLHSKTFSANICSKMDLSMSRMTRRMLSTFLWSSSAEPASSRQLNDDRGSSDFDEEGDDPYGAFNLETVIKDLV